MFFRVHVLLHCFPSFIVSFYCIEDNPTEWVSSDNKVYCPNGGGVDRPRGGQGGLLRPHREGG